MTTNENLLYVTIKHMSIGEEFVLWLRDQMTDRNWSQSDLAKASGISKQAISNILNQTRAPGPEVCISIAKALNLDPQFVFIKAGLFPELQDDESTLVREIKYKISMLSEDKLQSLLDIVDAFFSKIVLPMWSPTKKRHTKPKSNHKLNLREEI